MNDENQKTTIIPVRVTAQQRKIIARAAEKKGLDVSSWLRSLGLDAARDLGVDEITDGRTK